MTKSVLALVSAAVLFGTGNLFSAEPKNARDRLHDRIGEVNDAAKKVGVKTAFQRVSTETGVPVAQLEALHKRYSDIGPAGVLICSVMADETKKPAEDFARANQSGKSWTKVANDNRISTEILISRLDRFERALGRAETKAENKDREKRK
jgi:hypothetical protein